MSKCEVSGDKHSFQMTNTGRKGDLEIYQYITCISCGERRALTNNGELLLWDGNQWLAAPKAKGKEDV